MDGLVCVVTMRQLVLLLSTLTGACGDNVHVKPDASGVIAFEPAPHVPMPLILPHAGMVLSSVGLITLTFDGYADRGAVERFGDSVLGSEWFRAVCHEYEVDGGRQLATGSLGPAPASITRDDIVTRVRTAMDGGLVPQAGDPPALYLVYVPPGVARGADLQRIHGYHDTIDRGTDRVALAVVFDDGRGISATTTAAARALVDAATNPYLPPHDGFYADPPMSDPWSLVRGEIADLCAGEEPTVDLGWSLPRIYSNRAATAGYAPCTPADGDAVWTNVTAEPSQLRTAPRGSSVQFTLTGWSTAPTADWRLRVEATELSTLTIAQMHPLLSNDTINNNTSVTLTLQVPRGIGSGAFGGVVIESGPSAHPWVVGFVVE
jgi:hypothetical protein